MLALLFEPEDGGGICLRNIDKFLPDYKASHPGSNYVLPRYVCVLAACRAKAILIERRSLAWLSFLLQKRAGAHSRVCHARTGKRGNRMLARRATVNRAASNARSWDPARQVGEICDY
jgi:hypothetical protein